MHDDEPLHLYEEVLLLALRDEEGTIAGSWYLQALAGAMLAELLLDGRIRITADGKHVIVAKTKPEGPADPLLESCIETIAKARRPRSLATWLSKLSGLSDLKHRAAEGLCERRILKADRDKVLLFFERRIYPTLDEAPETALVERLRKLIFSHDSGAADPRTIVLLSLAHQTELLNLVFDKKELKARKAHIQGLIEGETLGAAAKKLIEAQQVAICAACLVPVITS